MHLANENVIEKNDTSLITIIASSITPIYLKLITAISNNSKKIVITPKFSCKRWN